jgi:hypothetical protein
LLGVSPRKAHPRPAAPIGEPVEGELRETQPFREWC